MIDKIKIFDVEYKIEKKSNKEIAKLMKDDDDKSYYYGVCDNSKALIIVNEDIENEQCLKDTLYHEAMHAILEIHFSCLIDMLKLDEEAAVRMMTAVRHEQFNVYNQIYN